MSVAAGASRPRVSCIIPVHNGKRDLPRAVDSVLAQGESAQVVVVDDASTDGTGELATELGRRDPRVVAVRLFSNRGQSYARNVGVGAADADYVTFLDHDDEHIAGWYDYAAGELDASPECAGIKGCMELAGLPPDLAVASDDPRLPAMNNSVIWNLVLRKWAYQAVGGCPVSRVFRLRGANEDIALMMALSSHFSLAQCDYPCTVHYVTPGGHTDYFLRRTRVHAGGFEFTEVRDEERDRTIEDAIGEYVQQAGRNVAALRLASR